MAYLGNSFFKKGSIVRKSGYILFVCFGVFVWSFKGIEAIYEFNRMRFSWSSQLSTLHAGLVSKIIYGEIKKSQSNDMAVNTADVTRMLEQNSSCMHDSGTANAAFNAVRPDIIIVQSESFFDPAILQGVKLPDNLLRNYKELMAEGAVGQMKVPTFGGGTIRTEYEVLTAVDLAAYPLVQFPYFEMRTPNKDSLASEVKKNGYEAIAIHGNAGSFWNRTKVFKAAGFDKFLTIDDFPEGAKRDGAYLSDHSMTDLVMEQLADDTQPKFIFAISIEAHGPYTLNSISDTLARDGIPVPATLSAAGAEEYKNYIYHINNADQQLGRLKEYLDARGKPYVLAFYGDHLPGLKAVYEELGFKNGSPATEQWVPWVMTGNIFKAKPDVDSSWKLGAAVLKEAGLGLSPYYKLVSCLGGATNVATKGDVDPEFYSVARAQTQDRLNDFVVSGEEK